MSTLAFLLDTDCVIHCLKGNMRAIGRVRQAEPAGLALSILSYAELWEGVFHARDPKSSIADLEEFVAHLAILQVTNDICRRFGEVRGKLRKTNELIGDFDLMIAVTALEHNLTLFSNNRKHFAHIKGLRLESI